MTDEQQAMYDALPSNQRAEFDRLQPDQQVMYFGWNDALRGYYWDLTPQQREAWWYLDDEQRISLFQMSPDQQSAAWNSITQQVAELTGNSGQQTATARTTATRSARATEINFVNNAVVQDIPAPHEGEYPVCESDADDNCINKWAAGQRGPGVERPLGYWPGDNS
jgi:hypothetical protein